MEMSFSRKYVHKHRKNKTTNLMCKRKKRKEHDSLAIQTSPIKFFSPSRKRASPFASNKKEQGSITVEAALAIPIFFLAVICLIYIMEIMAIQTSVKCATHYACKKAAKEVVAAPVLLPGKVTTDLVEAIGANRLDRSIVVGGSRGIHCHQSWVNPVTAVVQLEVSYQVKLPFPQFHIPVLSYKESMKMKGWTGYVKDTLGHDGEEIVYVTDTGTVYHRDCHCTHLDLSIQMVTGSQVLGLRNENQGRYKPCEKCIHGGSTAGVVYITNTGNRYHGSLSCSGLKRKIYAVPLSQVKGKGACSRCGR